MQKRSKTLTIWTTFGQKSSRGPCRDALDSFGVPKRVPGAVLGVKSWFVGPPLDAQMGALFRDFFNAKFACFFVCFLNAFRDEFASILYPKMHSKVSQKWKTCIFEFERFV